MLAALVKTVRRDARAGVHGGGRGGAESQRGPQCVRRGRPPPIPNEARNAAVVYRAIPQCAWRGVARLAARMAAIPEMFLRARFRR